MTWYYFSFGLHARIVAAFFFAWSKRYSRLLKGVGWNKIHKEDHIKKKKNAHVLNFNKFYIEISSKLCYNFKAKLQVDSIFLYML